MHHIVFINFAKLANETGSARSVCSLVVEAIVGDTRKPPDPLLTPIQREIPEVNPQPYHQFLGDWSALGLSFSPQNLDDLRPGAFHLRSPRF